MKKLIENLSLFLITIILINGIYGCGKKGPPVPLKKHIPPMVKNLQYHLNGDLLELTWVVPGKTILKEYRLSGSIIYRSRISMVDSDCRDCPPRFKRVADIPVDTDASGNVVTENMVYRETLKKGYYYKYKVILYSDEGVSGRDSEYVSFEY